MLYIQNRDNYTLGVIENFYNDTHQKILSSGVSTYDFTVSKNQDYTEFLVEGNYVVLADDNGEGWKFTIMNKTETHESITVQCDDIGLELLNTVQDAWSSPTSKQPIEYYIKKAVKKTEWTININEISSLERTLKWEGRDTSFARLLSIATEFDNAELEFKVEFKNLRVVKQYINIFKARGTSKSEVQLIYGDTVDDITKTTSITDLRTALKGVGSAKEIPEGSPEGTVEEHVDFSGIYYDDGEYFSPAGDPFLYARTANQQFNIQEKYIEDFYEYDTSDAQELLNRTITQLKKASVPLINYEVSVVTFNQSLELGDTVTVIDHDYQPELLLNARVLQINKSYTDSSLNSIILGNFIILESNIDSRLSTLQNQLQSINIKPNYTWLRYAIDDKGNGMTSVPTADTKYVAIISNKSTGVLSDNPADYAGHWQLIKGSDGKDGIPGATGADGKTSYTHFAYADNVSGTKDFSTDDPTGRSYMGVYSDFTKADSTNPNDYVWSYTKGETGPEGTQGIPGKPGIDGKTPYTHVAYADNDEGGGFSQSPDNKAYMGWYSDFTQADSNDPSLYGWSLIKGADGKDGADGVAGKDGLGIKSTVIAYQLSSSGTDTPTRTWSTAVPTLVKGQYLWTRTTLTYTDNSSEPVYSVSYVAKDGNSGSDGRAGKDGVGIKSTAITYATSTSGTSAPTSGWVSTPPSATAGQFIWTRTIWTYTDNTTETGYSVGKIGEKGATGADGANGAPGKPGADGKTPYFHQAWADSKDGKVNFSTTDPTNRGYLGTYSDFTQADSTDPTKYFWVELVGNLKIGGTNLAKGTSSDWKKITTSGWGISNLSPMITNIVNGEEYVISVEVRNVTQPIALEAWMCDANSSHTTTATQSVYSPISNQVTTLSAVFTANVVAPNVAFHPNLAFQRDLGTTVGSYEYRCVKFERGNKATDWSPAPEDTQQQIDTINQGLLDTNSKIAAVTKVDSQATAPTNPKKGDQWWVKDANGNINAFKIWDGTKWADSIIQQSAMNIGTLNGNIINGATINGSEFTNNFDFTGDDKNHFQGATQIKEGSVNITWKIPENNQTGETKLDANGLMSVIRDSSGTALHTARLQMGQLELSQWVSGSGSSANFLRGNFDVQDLYSNFTRNVQWLGGWGDWGSGRGLMTITRQGRQVNITAYPHHDNSTAMGNIFQLPAWAKPANGVGINITAVCYNSGVGNAVACRIFVDKDGLASINGGQSGGYVVIGQSYVGVDI